MKLNLLRLETAQGEGETQWYGQVMRTVKVEEQKYYVTRANWLKNNERRQSVFGV